MKMALFWAVVLKMEAVVITSEMSVHSTRLHGATTQKTAIFT
jgi:hypothetical protein